MAELDATKVAALLDTKAKGLLARVDLEPFGCTVGDCKGPELDALRKAKLVKVFALPDRPPDAGRVVLNPLGRKVLRAVGNGHG